MRIFSTENPAPTTEIAAEDETFPEGVDLAFLEALPESIRQEVIADQLRLQRLRQQNRQSRTTPNVGAAGATAAAAPGAAAAGPSFVAEVSPEFLAALPPELQDEVTKIFRNSSKFVDCTSFSSF